MLWRRQSQVEPRLVWMFGSPRSGSTWLLNLLASDPAVAKVDEPWIAGHLGISVGGAVGLPDDRRVLDARGDWPDYFFSHEHRDAWAGPLRQLLLARFSDAARSHRWVAIKEPLSEAGDLILSLLPKSRLVFLLRDGRDVVDSELDGVSEGGWILDLLAEPTPVEDRIKYVRERAQAWLRRTELVQAAFDAHDPDLRICVRYEDLLTQSTAELQRIGAWLDLDLGRLSTAAEAMDFQQIAARGRGKFVRSAQPGAWRENMTNDEQDALGEILNAKLTTLGYK